jgi:hypothetical protein
MKLVMHAGRNNFSSVATGAATALDFVVQCNPGSDAIFTVGLTHQPPFCILIDYRGMREANY